MSGRRQPDIAACRVCCGPATPGWSICGSCSAVALALRCRPTRVTPTALVGAGSDLYRAIRQYKWLDVEVAGHQSGRLSALLSAHWAGHAECVAPDAAPDVAVVVPSGRGGRRPPHPFERVVAAGAGLPAVARLLVRGEGPVDHRQPHPDAYRVVGDVQGVRILLLDDLYTSGAHLQSAASALVMAGASSVAGLTIGRLVPEAMVAEGCPRCGAARAGPTTADISSSSANRAPGPSQSGRAL